MRHLTLILATLFLHACGHKEVKAADESNSVTAAVPAPSNLEVQSSGSIYHIDQSDLEAVRRRGQQGDKAAVKQLINYYMFSASEGSDGEVLLNQTLWLEKGISLGVAGADQTLLSVASKRSGPPCHRIRQIIEHLPKDDRANFPQSAYVQACLKP